MINTEIIWLLMADFFLLAIVFFFYVRKTLRERAELSGQLDYSRQLQQKIYQIEVLQEINERIGYTLDAGKIVEIVTGSIGPLVDYDTVSYILYDKPSSMVLKCEVHNAVSHDFISQVKQNMISASSFLCPDEASFDDIDLRLSGSILNDSYSDAVKSDLNIPIAIHDELVGLINISSTKSNLYSFEQAAVVFSITNQAAAAMTQLEKLLDNEKGKLLGVISSMTDGVMMVGKQNELLVHNPAVVDILQLPVGKPVTFYDIIDALAGKVDLRTKIEEAIATLTPVSIPQLFLKDKAINLTVTAVKDKNGQVRGAAVILHDVTSEKSLEKLRQEFTAMMVHELRAPLTAVRWSASSILKASDSLTRPETSNLHGSVEEMAKTIDLAAGNMLDLVNDLLDVAKIEAGKFDLNIQQHNLVEVAKTEAATFEPLAASKHLVINLSVPEKVVAYFDSVRVSQVFNNLLSNAIKYTDSGQIDVHISEPENGQVVVSIKDSGIGVSREDLNILFSKFKQLQGYDNSRKGTGLGLVVSKGIIEAHGGKIWAESAGENLGTTFAFSLPLRAVKNV